MTLKIGSFKIAACERCVFAHHFNCERRTHQIIHQFSYWWFFVCVLNAKFIIATDSHKKPRKWHKQIVNLHKIERYHGKLCDELLLLRLSPCIFMTERRKKIIEKNIAKKRQNNGSSYFWDDDAYDVNSSLHLNKTLFCFLRTCSHNVWSKNNKLKQTNLDMNFKIMMMTN